MCASHKLYIEQGRLEYETKPTSALVFFFLSLFLLSEEIKEKRGEREGRSLAFAASKVYHPLVQKGVQFWGGKGWFSYQFLRKSERCGDEGGFDVLNGNIKHT